MDTKMKVVAIVLWNILNALWLYGRKWVIAPNTVKFELGYIDNYGY